MPPYTVAGTLPEAQAEDLKKIYQAKSQEEPRKPYEVCGSVGARRIPRSWSVGRPRLMLFSRFYVTLSPSTATSTPPTSWSGAKEVKRRTKVGETFCSEDAVEKLFYLFLSQLDEAWGARKLRGFAKMTLYCVLFYPL